MLDLTTRLAVLLDLPLDKAEGVLSAADPQAVAAGAAARTGGDAAQIANWLQDPLALSRARIDLAAATPSQLRRLGAAEAGIAAFLAARPPASIADAARILGLDADDLGDLFAVGELKVPASGGAASRLIPVSGTLVGLAAERRGEFEGPVPGLVHRVGPVEIREITAGFEAATAEAYGGWVLPLLRDETGAERCFAPGRIEVWIAPEAAFDAAVEELAGLDLVVLDRDPAARLVLVRLVEPGPDLLGRTGAMLARIGALGSVTFAEPEEFSLRPDFEGGFEEAERPDTGAGGIWPVVPRDWPLDQIGAGPAGRVARGDPRDTIIFVDSGADLDHPDYAAALRTDWPDLALNFAQCRDVRPTASPHEATHPHGTGVASVASGQGDGTGPGVVGIAPGARFLPVRIAECTSYGKRAAAILRAVAALPRPGIINLSWATASDHEGVFRAIRSASEAGHVVVASAGNHPAWVIQSADLPHFPSDYCWHDHPPAGDRMAGRRLRGVASVAALDHRGAKASYSYYGRHGVTLSAPGGERPGSGPGIYVSAPTGTRRMAHGTSFAAPMVAAAIAVLLSADRSLSPHAALSILERTARPLTGSDPAHAPYLGAGGLDLPAALAELGVGPPAEELPGLTPAAPPPAPPATARLDLNAARPAQIASLPYLGDWTAGRIVASRIETGPFAAPASLVERDLLDAWTLARIRDLVEARMPA